MSSNLYKHVNYSANIPFLISNIIKEYDISKANINILYKYGIITSEQYQYFLNCPRNERQIKIGLMERSNPKISEIKKRGIEESRKLFFEQNDIIDTEVLSIKNDAIFLINKTPIITKFDNIEFVHRNTYSSFYKLNHDKIEAYYSYNEMTDTEILDIKGISDDKLKLHKEYFVDFLLSVFQTAEISTIDEALKLIASFNQMYVGLELDVGFYRNFDSTSKFELPTSDRTYYLEYINENDKKVVNIMCNMNIVREIWSYLGSIKFKYRKI